MHTFNRLTKIKKVNHPKNYATNTKSKISKVILKKYLTIVF